MIAGRHVLLAWSCASLVPWLVIWKMRPGLREAMRWSSLFALPFGFSELMFAGTYWSPPSLFDLAARIHLDIESFVFLFAAGGVASVAYNLAARSPVRVDAPPHATPSRPLRNFAFAAPACVFAVALLALREPLEAGVVAMAAGAVARAIVRRDLARKAALGAMLFGAYYAALLGSLAWLEPEYVASVWSRSGPPALRALGVPVSELAFGTSFGAYWSGLFEQYRWTFAPRSQRERARE